jgi:hypothetical protein
MIGSWRRFRWAVAVLFLATFFVDCRSPLPEVHGRTLDPGWLSTDRHWDVLLLPGTPPGSPLGSSPAFDGEPARNANSDPGLEQHLRDALGQAGSRLGDWRIDLAGVALDGARLRAWSTSPAGEPLLRFVREDAGRAIDLTDLLFFLDDVLRDAPHGLRDQVVWLTPSRARKAGILLHPDDVFLDAQPRRYGTRKRIAIDQPEPQVDLEPARDGDPPGPGWTARFRNPADEAAMLAALAAAPGASGFSERIAALLAALREAGARVSLNSTLRSPERGYLMWGAFLLGQARSADALEAIADMLDDRNVRWKRNVAITWRHPNGWLATQGAARAMAETYQVAYATESGARASDHYTGRAVDFEAIALPRRLELRGLDGRVQRFDLSDSHEARDLSLTPQLIDFVEHAYGLEKLSADYPHWVDSRTSSTVE